MPLADRQAIRLAPEQPDEVVERNPTHIWIEPTNRCNTRCVHCGHFYELFGSDMDEELYEKIRDQALDGVERAELIGYGEPLMAKNFWRMFEECAARDIEIYTTSNGILLRNDERVSRIVRNRVVLCLSIDGATRETFESVRPYIKWHKLMETLDCLKRNAEQAGEECRYRLRFNFVVMKRNIGELAAMVQLAHDYNAEEVFVLPLGGEDVFEKVEGESLDNSPELVSPNFIEALALADELGVHLTVPESYREMIFQGAERLQGVSGRVKYFTRKAQIATRYLRKHGMSKVVEKLKKDDKPRAKAGVTYCNMPWNDAYFASDGTVFPCCIMGEKLGNMKEQSWEEAWNSQAYRNLRRTVHSWNPNLVCRTCALPTGINGGDQKHYAKFFGRFQALSVPLDSPDVGFEEGFYDLERLEDGSPSHRWMSKSGTLTLKKPRGAKFLRLRLIVRAPVHETNPGRCQINGGEIEPFDNSCGEVHFHLSHVEGDRVEVLLEMENSHRVEGDGRDLALPIWGIEFLK